MKSIFTKLYLFGIVILLYSGNTFSQSPQKNFILTKSYHAKLDASIPVNYTTTNANSVDVSVTYLDVMGRPIQEIDVQASPNGNDIIQLHEYDKVGREARVYLPFTSSNNNGAFISNAGSYTVNSNKELATGAIANFYNGSIDGIVQDNRPFAKYNYEASPSSRVVSTIPIGQNFQVKTNTYDIRFNTLGDEIFQIEYSGLSTSNTVISTGKQDLTKYTFTKVYGAKSLYVSEQVDADGKPSTIFTNMQGLMVCKRSYSDAKNAANVRQLDTYYVYDDLGQLRCVIPPAYISAIKLSLRTSLPRTLNSLIMNDPPKLFYFYDYDNLGRVISKETPHAGDGVEYIIYDNWDRVRCTQNGNQRVNKQWTIISYDKLNRIAFTGEVLYDPSVRYNEGSGSPLPVSTNYDRFLTMIYDFKYRVNNRYEISENGGDFYTFAQSLPSSINVDVTNILSVNYYDNYNFSKPGFESGNQNAIHSEVSGVYDTQIRGELTGTRKKILGTKNTWKRDVTYYDFDGNGIASAEDLIGIPNSPGGEVSSNLDLGGPRYNGAYEWTNNVFSWDGKLEKSSVEHRGITSSGIKKIIEQYNYDHEGRLLTTSFRASGNTTLDTGKVVQLTSNVYNELGQLRRQTLGNNPNAPIGKQKFAQQFTYSYHITGMLKEAIGQQFSEKIYYEHLKNDALGVNNGSFTGLVGEVYWQSGGKAEQGQKFTYDYLNRLKATSGINYPFAERNITYDDNNNISTLTRVWNNVVIDSLSYNYFRDATAGVNKFLQSITDNANPINISKGVKPLSNLPNLTQEYSYDANGNLTRDGKRGIITDIKYNNIDLVENLVVNNKTVNYLYAADGEKLVADMGTEKTVYAGAFEYDGSGIVQRVGTGVGQIVREVVGSTAQYRYQYYLEDRLGNVRVVVNEVGDTLQRNDYLAYGMQISYGNTTKNKYLYEGNELQTEMGWFDFGARMYDPTIGRWHGPDPMNQFVSPYDFVGGDPINNIDPDGMYSIPDVEAPSPSSGGSGPKAGGYVNAGIQLINFGLNGGFSGGSTSFSSPVAFSRPPDEIRAATTNIVQKIHNFTQAEDIQSTEGQVLQFGVKVAYSTVNSLYAVLGTRTFTGEFRNLHGGTMSASEREAATSDILLSAVSAGTGKMLKTLSSVKAVSVQRKLAAGAKKMRTLNAGRKASVARLAKKQVPTPSQMWQAKAYGGAAKTGGSEFWIQGTNKSTLNTMMKGRYAVESVPGNATRNFSTVRSELNLIGQKYGCHTCGTKTANGVYIPDHQPSLKLNPNGPFELFPHCPGCSRLQGGQVNKVLNH